MNGRIGALFLVLLLPACALAVTEGVVEEAPQIELEPAQEAPFLQTDQLMEAYRDRAREVLRQHMGREEAMAFCYHRLMNAAFDYDGQGDPGEWQEDGGIPVVMSYFTHPDSGAKAFVAFDQQTGRVVYAEDGTGAPPMREEDAAPLTDEEAAGIAAAYWEKTLSIRDYAWYGDPVREGRLIRLRIRRDNGDMLGVRMNARTGEIYCTELYSLGEERAFASYEQRAQEAVCQAFFGADMQLLDVKETAYLPAAIDEAGGVRYGQQTREGIEVRLVKNAAAAHFSYEAHVLFDRETDRIVRIGRTFDFSGARKAVLAQDGRIRGDDFALRMAQACAADIPGCEQMTFSISPQSDARYAVCAGLTRDGWRFEFRLDRQTGNAVSHEFLRVLTQEGEAGA